MDNDLEFDDSFDDEEVEIEEEAPKKRSPLRIILLVLLILVLLCVVCYFGSTLLSGAVTGLLPSAVTGMLPGGAEPPPVPPVATEELPPPPEAVPGETVEPAPAATEEPQPLPETDEAAPTSTPAEESVPPTEEAMPPTEEPVEETTTEPVPGPTSTPTVTPSTDVTPEVGPTIVATVVTCDDNVPPEAVANGPYEGMIGKGQAFVNFDATGSNDADGTIVQYRWEFGDDSAPVMGQSVVHGYTNPGNYVAILTVTDDCNATGQDTAEVTIVGPTPPAPGETPTAEPTAEPTNEPPATDMTMGFCYLVQYGDTLSGIAWYYGLPVQDLALVNGTSPESFLFAGQGLFIPIGRITEGPNAYMAHAGDTIYNIAYQCGVPPATLAGVNGLNPNEALTPGQIIIIPLGR